MNSTAKSVFYQAKTPLSEKRYKIFKDNSISSVPNLIKKLSLSTNKLRS